MQAVGMLTVVLSNLFCVRLVGFAAAMTACLILKTFPSKKSMV